MSYFLGHNSTACPNAAQNTRLRNLKKLRNIKPPTHKTDAFYNLADQNTIPPHATHHEGP